MGVIEESKEPRASTTSGRIKTSITLPRSVLERIRRSASLNKRTPSFEIELAVEEYLQRVEQDLDLSTKID